MAPLTPLSPYFSDGESDENSRDSVTYSIDDDFQLSRQDRRHSSYMTPRELYFRSRDESIGKRKGHRRTETEDISRRGRRDDRRERDRERVRGSDRERRQKAWIEVYPARHHSQHRETRQRERERKMPRPRRKSWSDEREEPRAMSFMRHIFAIRNIQMRSRSPKVEESSMRTRVGSYSGDTQREREQDSRERLRDFKGERDQKQEVRERERERSAKKERKVKDPRRLGVSELGIFAYEKQMPEWLVKLLERRGTPTLPSQIPSLARHLACSTSTSYAYLCHPLVSQVFKLRREGHFCGYRNIQVLTSYILNTSSPGVETLDNKIPSIFRIQDLVEAAWDAGINEHGRAETGGIKGTRKFIGTSEAEAMMIMIGAGCGVRGFTDPSRSQAAGQLLRWFEGYFERSTTDRVGKVRQTELPPVYLQNPRHSMTVVGIERTTSGSLNLLVFDPKYYDHNEFTYLSNRTSEKATEDLLHLYRRGMRYLGCFNKFETLYLRTDDLPVTTGNSSKLYAYISEEDSWSPTDSEAGGSRFEKTSASP